MTRPLPLRVPSPCHNVPTLVEPWQVRYAQTHTDGVMRLRCGSVLDTGGWPGRRVTGGCGEVWEVDVADAREQLEHGCSGPGGRLI